MSAYDEMTRRAQYEWERAEQAEQEARVLSMRLTALQELQESRSGRALPSFAMLVGRARLTTGPNGAQNKEDS